METTLKIQGISEATSQKGTKYWKVQTDQGNMSCFEENVAKELMKSIDNDITVEIAKSGNFTNIRGVSSNQMPKVENAVSPQETEVSKETKYPKVSREKLAEGLSKQAVDIVCFGSKDLNIEEAREMVFETYQYFVEEVTD